MRCIQLEIEIIKTETTTNTTKTGSVLGFDSLWQMPAKTEKHAYDLVLAKDWSFNSSLYVGFPWANLIDGLNRCAEIGSALKNALDTMVIDQQYKRIITVCQHIKFREHITLFKQIGVTDIFASHAFIDERVCEGINIHPFPLYPVQAAKNECSQSTAAEQLEEFTARKYRYSFIGAYNPNYYLTNSRELLFGLPRNDESLLLDRNQWHFENRVYSEQIYGKDLSPEDTTKETDDAEEFVAVLKNTKFSPCPSGTGPNSIRLWESIEYGCIPVILADTLRLPGKQDLWSAGCIILNENEKDIANLPDLLKSIENNKEAISKKLASLAQIKLLYGQDVFITDIENLVKDIEEASQVTDEVKAKVFYLETSQLDDVAIRAWFYYINLISCHLNINSVIFVDGGPLSDLSAYSDLFPWVTIKPKVHGFDQCHNWTDECLAYISDSRVLSTQLIQKFSSILMSPQSNPIFSNPSLFDEICLLKQAPAKVLNEQSVHYADFPQLDVLSELQEWVPSCSILTSMYDGDEYVEGFLDNCSRFTGYENIEHFIVRPASPGTEHSKVRDHVKHNRGAVYIWLNEDPGLYEVWNECCKLSSSKYLTNANIDDRRSPDHINSLTKALDDNPDVDIASSALRVTNNKNLSWDDSGGCNEWYTNEAEEKYNSESLLKLRDGVLVAYNMPHCMPVWRHFLHTMNGYFNEPEFGPSSDWEFWLRCGQHESKFYLSSQALGLYLQSVDSYWHRTTNATAFDRTIIDIYSDSNLTYTFDGQANTLALRIAKMLDHRRQSEDLAFLFDFFHLVKSFNHTEFAGKNVENLINHIGRNILHIDEIEDLMAGICPDFKKQGEDRSVTEFLAFLTSITHSLGEKRLPGWQASAELIKHACTELYVTTQHIEPILIKAYISHLNDDEIMETHFLQRAYKKFPDAFWKHFQSVYRFSRSLKDVADNLESLPSFGNFNDIKPDQSLYSFPDYTHGNPYQNLLYGSLRKSGVNLHGIMDLNELDSGEIEFNKGDICHIHWINIVFKDVQECLLKESIDNFLKVVASLKSKGMNIYWTIHNQYSHDFPNKELEKSFRKRLYNLADKVFVHHPILLAQLGEWLPDTRKIEFIEHGNYIGWYPDKISSKDARSELGLNPGDLVISVLGQIRPYKDLHKLLPTIRKSMQLNNRLKLVVAGKINCEKTLSELALMPREQVLVKNEFIGDDDIQKYIKAASFVLLSYRDILTSGSLFQAFSFGIPVIAPTLGSIPAYVIEGWNGFLYRSPDDIENILSGSKTLTSLVESKMGNNALTSAKSLSWSTYGFTHSHLA